MASNKLLSFATRFLVVIVLLVISISIFVALVSTKPQLAVEVGERSLPAVVVMDVKQVPIQRSTVGYGTADAIQHADVPTEVSSTVLVLPPTTRVGRPVKRGELLVELDSRDFRQQLVRAEQAYSSSKSALALLEVERVAAEERASLANEDMALAEVEFKRIQEAQAKGAAKQREVDAAKQKLLSVSSAAINANEAASRFPAKEEQAYSNVSSASAEVELARENVKRCNVVSPIDGVIQDVDVRVGEHVNKGKRIARIVNSSSMEIPLRLPSHARAFVQIGDEAKLRSAGFGKRKWESRVGRIAPEDDASSRTMIVYLDINQDALSGSSIPPGLFVRGEVRSAKDTMPRWVVPRRSVREDRVLIVRDGVIRSIPVSVDYSVTSDFPFFNLPDQDWVVLESALTEGDFLIVDPGGSLRDGMGVRAILASEVVLE
jgi:RND family efflux transporter MFP subunit